MHVSVTKIHTGIPGDRSEILTCICDASLQTAPSRDLTARVKRGRSRTTDADSQRPLDLTLTPFGAWAWGYRTRESYAKAPPSPRDVYTLA